MITSSKHIVNKDFVTDCSARPKTLLFVPSSSTYFVSHHLMYFMTKLLRNIRPYDSSEFCTISSVERRLETTLCSSIEVR